MENFILGLIESSLNFQLGSFILFYLVLLWVLVAVWVFIDGYRRYKSVFLGLLFSFIVLTFNIPGLLFYIILRPEKSEDNLLIIQDNIDYISKKGINLPIINFTDKDGNANISINLSVSKNLLDKEIGNYDQHNEKSDLRINIDLNDIDNKKFKVSEDRDNPHKTQMSNLISGNINKSKQLYNISNLLKICLVYLDKIRNFLFIRIYKKMVSYVDNFRKQDSGADSIDTNVITNQKTNTIDDAERCEVDMISTNQVK